MQVIIYTICKSLLYLLWGVSGDEYPLSWQIFKFTGKIVKFEDIKGLIRIRNEKSKKNRQHNDRKEKQRSTKHTHKTKNRVTRTQLKTGGERMPKNSFLFLAKYWNLASTSICHRHRSFLFVLWRVENIDQLYKVYKQQLYTDVPVNWCCCCFFPQTF